MRAARRIFGIDGALVGSVCLLVLASLYVLSTAIVRPDGGVDDSFAHRQAVFAIIGIAIAIAISRVPIGWWAQWWPHAFVATVVSIAVVRFIGTEVNGARSWIDLGPISLQPSEFGKTAMLVAAGGFIASRQREIRDTRMLFLTLGLLGLPAFVVLVQPDFGTAQIYGWLALGMLFFAGARWTHLAILGGGLVVVLTLVMVILPAAGLPVLKDYQMQRLTGFLDPEADAQGANYQTIQAKIAIGSGQFVGRPKEESSQVQQGFLPEPQTDFIFATLVERWGFLGGAALLGLYMLLVSRLLFAAGTAASPFGRLVAGGAATLIGAQVFTNVGMVIGVLPVTGVPLPLFSYGGSSMWTSMALIGLVLAVLRESETPTVRYERRTGRPAAGYGSLRASSGERVAGNIRAGRMSAGLSPLTGGQDTRRRVRARTRSRNSR